MVPDLRFCAHCRAALSPGHRCNCRCPDCGGATVKVIYLGLPGRLCEDEYCSRLSGVAALAGLAPGVACDGPDGEPAFEFMAYTGSYWRALWRWLTSWG